MLDDTVSGDSMALKVINKINGKLKFFYGKNKLLSSKLWRKLCNGLIQPHFDYACPPWYLKNEKCQCQSYWKMKKQIQIMQNKCIRCCVRPNKMHYISEEDFKLINWWPTSKRVDQCINTITLKFALII